MCKTVKTVNDCMDSKKVEATVNHFNIPVRKSGGDHFVMSGYDKNTHEKISEVYCNRDMGRGLAHKVFKFFVAIGAVGGLILMVDHVGITNFINFANSLPK
jgi:hypothetical protein